MSAFAWDDSATVGAADGGHDAFAVIYSSHYCMAVKKRIRWRGFVDRGEARREWGRSQRARRRRGRFLRKMRKQGFDWTRRDALR